MYTLTPYALSAALAAFACILVIALAWPKRSAPGGKILIATMAAAAIWAGNAAMGYASLDIPTRTIWLKLGYIGVVLVTPLSTMFAVTYAGFDQWLTRRTIVVLFLIPLITLVAAFTNEYHHLIWTEIVPIPPLSNNLVLVKFSSSLLGVGHIIYSWLLGILASSVLIYASITFPTVYRRQYLDAHCEPGTCNCQPAIPCPIQPNSRFQPHPPCICSQRRNLCVGTAAVGPPGPGPPCQGTDAQYHG